MGSESSPQSPGLRGEDALGTIQGLFPGGQARAFPGLEERSCGFSQRQPCPVSLSGSGIPVVPAGIHFMLGQSTSFLCGWFLASCILCNLERWCPGSAYRKWGHPWLVLAFGQSCPLPDPVCPVAHPQGAVRRAWSAQVGAGQQVCLASLSITLCLSGFLW